MEKQGDINLCPICRDEFDFYSYGSCDHPTCARCAVKIRKFGSTDEPDFSKCASCRGRLNRVIIMKSFIPFDEVDISALIHQMEFDFYFENEDVAAYFKKFMTCTCSTCGYTAPSMSALNCHTSSLHNLSYCDLCLKHARLLPCEFVALSPRELAIHHKWDKQKKRGHPVCEFCNGHPFYEFEDLVKHIREVHFLCDFCHAIKGFEVFRRQNELFEHYKDAHHVCPECELVNRMACFASVDQLGLHRLHEHPKESENDPNRWDPIQIRFSTQGLIGQHGRIGGPGRSYRSRDGPQNQIQQSEQIDYVDPSPQGPRPEDWTGSDFPTLFGGSTSTETVIGEGQQSSTRQKATRSLASVVGSGNTLSTSADDFPSLPGAPVPSSGGNIVRSNLEWIAKQTVSKRCPHQEEVTPQQRQQYKVAPKSADFPNLSSNQVTAPQIGNWGASELAAAATTVAKPTLRQQPPKKSDFPSLGSGSAKDLSSASYFSPPSLPSFTPPIKSQSSTGSRIKSQKGKQQLKPQTTGPPVSAAVAKAQRAQWWDEADNDGAFLTADDEIKSHSNYNRIQIIESAPVHYANQEQPDFTPQEFPSLSGEGCKKQESGGVGKKTRKQASNGIASNTIKASSVTTMQQKINGKADNGLSLDLEDTETEVYTSNIYTPPKHSETKNIELIKVAERMLGDHTDVKNVFARFADLSRLFRYKQLTANCYLQGLDGLFSRMQKAPSGNQLDWLSGMVSLLPDVGLQRALLRALRGEAAPRVPNYATPNRAQAPPFVPNWAKLVTANLVVCKNCGQVCLRSNLKEHITISH